MNREYDRTCKGGNPLPSEGVLDNTGEGGLSPHHLSVSSENQEYLDLLTVRAKACGHDYQFRFDQTASSGGSQLSIPLSLNLYKIGRDGRAVISDKRDVFLGPALSEAPRHVILQIGPALAGYRTPDGQVDWEWLNYMCGLQDVAGIEIKGQQGAKPNDNSRVPKEKLTAELRALRGFSGKDDYVSPVRHPFIRALGQGVTLKGQVADLVYIFSRIQELPNVKRRGLPTGYKMKYCGPDFLSLQAEHLRVGQGPDYLVVDGAEGGTGAADITMTDHVGTHTYQGVFRTHNILTQLGVRDRVALVASGRLSDPGDIATVMCLGADYCNILRGYMMATGCIQARMCNTGNCPSGLTTHNWWRQRGLDPNLKAVRFANYGKALQFGLGKLARVAGVNFSAGDRFTLKNLSVVTGIGKLTAGTTVYRSDDE